METVIMSCQLLNIYPTKISPLIFVDIYFFRCEEGKVESIRYTNVQASPFCVPPQYFILIAFE